MKKKKKKKSHCGERGKPAKHVVQLTLKLIVAEISTSKKEKRKRNQLEYREFEFNPVSMATIINCKKLLTDIEEVSSGKWNKGHFQ